MIKKEMVEGLESINASCRAERRSVIVEEEKSPFSHRNGNRVDVVAALIRRNGTIMICQRPTWKARALEWEFVGGKVENGEELEDALVRECNEEIGVEVEVGSVFTEVEHVYSDISIHLYLFNCTLKDGEPKMKEHNDIRWVKAYELPNYKFCAADVEIIDRIIKEEVK